MINLINRAWDTDALAAINRLAANKAALLDPGYFYATVDAVEALRDPDTGKPLTTAALEAWEVRCCTAPTINQEGTSNAAQRPPRRFATPNRSVPHAAP